MLTRRIFLRGAALAAAGSGALPGWLARAAAEPGTRHKTLVVLFQRGAADGLNTVIPWAEKRYYDLRPGIAVAKSEAIELDGYFALHPSLKALAPLWESRQLAVVHAAGSPDPTRSHFDAQDYMESGTPGRKATRDGWLNRALPPAGGLSPVRAVSLGPVLPRALRGRNPAVAVSSLSEFRIQQDASSFQSIYAGDPRLRGAAKDTFEAVRLLESIEHQPYTPAASYPRGRFGSSLQQIARLIKAGAGVEAAFADIGGWDHHVNETPLLTNRLSEFGGALAAFWQDLGDRQEDVAVVTMSEFGRTARENGNRGTDHGHANCMFVLGGAVRGGKVYGKWPGLEPEQLHEGRDLAVTTDFREVLSELVGKQLGVPDMANVFPGYTAASGLGLIG